MLEIKLNEEYQKGDNVVEEKWFDLDGIEGHYLYEENWYEPLEYRFMQIHWNSTSIFWDRGYHIKGDIPSDEQFERVVRHIR